MTRRSRPAGFERMGLGLPLCAPGFMDAEAAGSTPWMHVSGNNAKPARLKKLRACAEAAMELEDIRSHWLLDIRAARQANKPDEAERLRKRQSAEMLQVIDATPNLTLEEYQSIALLAKSNQEVRDEIEHFIRRRETDRS